MFSGTERQRVYIAGPYSADDPPTEWANVMVAVRCGYDVMVRGHMAHVPHAATCFWHTFGGSGPELKYEDYMALDFSILERWATCLLLVGRSPGADREHDMAVRLRLPIIYSANGLPKLTLVSDAERQHQG